MCENCDCFKFYDVKFDLNIRPCTQFCMKLLPDSVIFFIQRTFKSGKHIDLGAGQALRSVMLAQEKSLSHFWPPFLEQPIKFLLIVSVFKQITDVVCTC